MSIPVVFQIASAQGLKQTSGASNWHIMRIWCIPQIVHQWLTQSQRTTWKHSTSRLLEIISQSAHPTDHNWEPNPVECIIVNKTLFTGDLGNRTSEIHLTIAMLGYSFHHWQLSLNDIEPIPSRWSIHTTIDHSRKCLIVKWRWHSNQTKLHCYMIISTNRIWRDWNTQNQSSIWMPRQLEVIISE